jgi:hypothetical protein
MAYNNLRFFDSDSNDLNLVFNTDLDLWQGVAYLPLVSTGLYETLTLHILENVEGQLFEDLHVTPIAEAVGTVSFKFRFSNDYNTSEDIFLSSAKSNAGEITVQKDLEQTAALLDNSIEVDYNTVTDKKIVTANLKANPIMVRAALNSEVEGFHVRPLSIIEVVNGVETREIARIKVYGEVEGEDERLRTLLTNIGMNLDDLDYFIFKDSNINEQSPDHILLNQKRKELLLQASQIKPFIGTYKALLNAVDFFGYDKVTLKEYWLNINEQSENFGKLKAVAVPNQDVIGFLADKNKTTDLPNSNQKKTSRFSLVYRLNTPTGKQDEWDMPIVEETLDYSPDEVLIKLYGLKNKLQKEYLPLQAKIVDITGEGDYFSQFNQNVWNNQHNIKAQEAGREYTVEKVPALRDVFMEDLRLVDYRLTGFNQDFEAIQGIYEQTNIGFTNFPAIISGNSNNILTITGEDLSKECTLDFSYLEGAISGSYVEILNVSFDGSNTIIKTSDAINSTSYTQPGISYIAIYSDTSKIICDSIETFYTEYYDNKLDTFNTMDGIPIGAPISLHIEEGLEDSWDFADFTWEDAGDEYSGKGVYNFSTDFTTDPTATFAYFKTLEDNGNKLLNWEDWWHRGIYEIEWKLIGPNGYNRSFRGPVYEYNHFPLTLPYVGSYTVEAHAHDLYNVTSTRIQKDWIEVKNKNVELYGLTQLAPKKLDWQEYVYSWDKSGSSWDWSRENTLPVSDTISTYYLTMDRANYIQDPEENGLEFSTVRRYQDTTPGGTGFKETSGPYQWSALDNHVWDDGPEVTWKMTRIGSDINSSFQIWALPNNQWINITQKDPGTGVISRDSYQILTTIPNNTIGFASQWQLIADELNSLDSNEHPILSKFNFNPIFEDITPFDIDGDSTPFPNTEDQLLYILSVAKEPARTYDFKSAWMSNIENSSPGSGTIREQLNFVSYNPGFDDTYIINGLVDLHKLNHVTFSYDLTNMPGIVSQNWKVTNNTLNIDDIYYSNQVLTHLFKDKGYYTVELEIQDSNGNKNTITKNILNII